MKSEKHVKYYKNGNIEYEEWMLPNGDHHREDGPAKIWYNEDGSKDYEHWFNNGKWHREEGPSYINWHEDGNIICEIWSKAGKIHREEGPSPPTRATVSWARTVLFNRLATICSNLS